MTFRTMIPKIRIHVAKKKQVANDSELKDVTDDFIAQQNKLLPDSDSDEEERIRSARIKSYWQSSVQLSPYGFAVRPEYVLHWRQWNDMHEEEL